MSIEIKKGNIDYLTDCVEALSKSRLGKEYFSSEGSAKKAVIEGIEQDSLYVALSDNECVGFFYIIPKGAFHSFPYLHLIVVKEEYRGKGIGKEMLDYSEKIAFELSDKIFLVVADFNPDAKRFYLKNGYSQVGEIPSLYRKGITEYLMMKQETHH